ncbi:beta-N-acetylhexosaminidase [Propionispira arboris]|uniref:beta-N-acetylhexosaminidase n=1 Tax=Propionispira arboris TaxID=84035 RepID=A0A1H7BX34_9FIRM|nr:glycoside hydrolase family 3 N-terminal domain-containing protein [Propionispira arboris]SEJ82021.1 beta-N-acetylhexosaminidase [Propionispira arboris]
MINLKEIPFYLSDDDIEWVNHTMSKMTLEEKIGQLFVLVSRHGTKEELEQIYKVLNPAGIMYRPMPIEKALDLTNAIQKTSKIPMLIAANLEKGGNGILDEGTIFGSPLEIAATDNVDMAKKLGLSCGREGAAVGANWAFAPIVDIDYNFRNPITNTRTFGSEPTRVKEMGLAYVNAIQECGLAASIKHFPGDGMDERDQHLVMSVNSMSTDDWDKTYGSIYKTCIDAGAKTCMIGHIMLPEYSKKLNPSLRDEDILPATLSSELMNDLLRDKLGFNGLIVTDATTMAGFTIPLPRSQAVPRAIASGADLFLFTKNLEEDYQYMVEGINSGIVSKERLDEAVLRTLALKASLKLHTKKEKFTIEKASKILGCEEHLLWAKECADQSVTLVKEEKNVLPLSVQKYKKILFYPIESEQGISYSVKAGVCAQFKELLEKEGFIVDYFVPPQGYEGNVSPARDVLDNYDLIVYLANMSTKSNQTSVRIEWAQPMGANCPHFQASIPTIFISVENPYHLLDVPRIKTFINAYNSNDFVLEALIEKLMGKSEFKGKSPVDPFCGKWDTKL